MIKDFNFLKFYLLILPLSFILGPAAFELFTFIGLVLFFICLNKIDLKVFYKVIGIFLLINLLLILISLFSIDTFQSFKSIIFLFRFIILSLFIAFIVSRLKTSDFKIIFYSISFVTLFIFVDSFIQLRFGLNITKFNLIEPSRASSFFGEELILGSFIFNLFVFNYFFFFTNK